jgi:hypothetical protein
MGSHRFVRAGSSQHPGWWKATIVGVGVGFASATVAGVGLASGTTSPTPSVYSAIAPVTVLGRSLAAHSNTDVTVAGVGSVPSNATSVQLSVTALDGTTTSSMYVYPTGATKPTSANVRWETGEVVTIPVTVAVGTNGDVRLTTDGGTVTVKVTVVGYFSPVPAPGGTGYGFAASGLSISDGGTELASLVVPAGTYDVQGKVYLGYSGSALDTVSCQLLDTTGAAFDFSSLVLDTDINDGTLSLVGLDTNEGGTLTMHCTDGSSTAQAYWVKLVATELSSASGDITGS